MKSFLYLKSLPSAEDARCSLQELIIQVAHQNGAGEEGFGAESFSALVSAYTAHVSEMVRSGVGAKCRANEVLSGADAEEIILESWVKAFRIGTGCTEDFARGSYVLESEIPLGEISMPRHLAEAIGSVMGGRDASRQAAFAKAMQQAQAGAAEDDNSPRP